MPIQVFFYQKEDSAWGFELNAFNLFNSTYKQSNSQSDFIISDTKTYILPRVVLFKIIYNLALLSIKLIRSNFLYFEVNFK